MMALSLLWMALAASAYIPEYSLIASHMADQHGSGAFQIEQEVTYRRETESYSVKETWVVLNENNLRVRLEGRGPLKGLVQGTIVYDGSQKSYVDDKKLRNQRLGEDWLVPLFHFRSSKYFRSRLVKLKVLPPETLHDRPALNHEGPPKYQPPSFIRLSRTGGAVTWAIGISPKVGVSPTVWVEQDRFVLRKFRAANQTILKADNYHKFDRSFFYPRTISYTFGDTSVQIKTLQVKYLGRLSAKDSRFKAAALKAGKDSLKLPDNEALHEFYSRYR